MQCSIYFNASLSHTKINKLNKINEKSIKNSEGQVQGSVSRDSFILMLQLCVVWENKLESIQLKCILFVSVRVFIIIIVVLNWKIIVISIY